MNVARELRGKRKEMHAWQLLAASIRDKKQNTSVTHTHDAYDEGWAVSAVCSYNPYFDDSCLPVFLAPSKHISAQNDLFTSFGHGSLGGTVTYACNCSYPVGGVGKVVVLL